MVAQRCHYEFVFSYCRASNCWVGISSFSQLPTTDGREHKLIEGPLATHVPVPSTQNWRKLESAEERMRVEENPFATYFDFFVIFKLGVDMKDLKMCMLPQRDVLDFEGSTIPRSP